jgi:protoporphyrinogen oxidase
LAGGYDPACIFLPPKASAMKKAIILGAGPAGLTAAYELLTRTDIKPVIIEMDSQVGGLSKTINYKGNLIDIGGHRFFSKSERIISWWLKFLPLADISANEIPLTYHNQTIELHSQGLNIPGRDGKMLIRPRKSRIYFDHSFFDYPLSFNHKTFQNFGVTKITRIALSYFKSKFFPIREELTLEQFFINRFGKELYQTFFKGYTEKIWGVPCDHIPADWGHQRIKDLNIGKAIIQSFKSVFKSNKKIHQHGVSTSLIEQFLYPEKGPGQMWETVAEKVKELGGEIYLGYEAEKIIVEKNQIQSITCRNPGAGNSIEFAGEYFFSTIPVKNLVASLVNIEVPGPVNDIASRLSYRDFIMVGLLFKKKNGENMDGFEMLTDNWIYLQDKDLIAGRLQIFNNWSPHMVADNNNLWIGMEYFCSESDAIWNNSRVEMIELALKEITGIGLIQKEALIDATVIKIPKAYPSYIGAYEQFHLIQEFLDKIGNLYLTGRNGMHRYNNADHSMMTAMIAVDNIISHQKDRSNIWAVNMEQDFHEESLKPKA